MSENKKNLSKNKKQLDNDVFLCYDVFAKDTLHKIGTVNFVYS